MHSLIDLAILISIIRTLLLLYIFTQFELKKNLVEHLVQLLSCGHVLPVVDYVAHYMEMESLDQSHIRYFVAEVCTDSGSHSLLLRV